MESLRGLFLRLLAASLVATALIAIAVLLVGDFEDTDAQILLTTLAISGYSLLALPGGVLLDRGERLVLAGAALAATALAFLLALGLIWITWSDSSETLAKVWSVATAGAGALSQAAAVASRRRAGDPAGVRRAAIASYATGALLATMISVAAVGEIDSETYYRFLGAAAVANVTLVVLQAVLRRMRPRTQDETVRLVVDVPSGEVDAIASDLRERGFRVERR